MQSIAVRVLEGYSMKLSKRALVRIVPVAVVLILVACGVTSVTGPTAVTIGQNATYDYAWSYGTTVGDPSSATNGTAEITVQIPNGWTVVSATYNGTVNGAPVSGNANTMAPTACLPAVPGYQFVGFSAGPFASSVGGDGGTFHVTYTIGGAAGTYTMTARGSATTDSFTNACGDTASLADIVVAAGTPLSVTKSFAPASVAIDAPSTLTVTLTNPNAFAANAGFTDAYPAGLVNAATPNASTTCSGTVTATAGSASLTLNNGSIPASSSCTVSVAVSSSTASSYPNTLGAGALTSTNAPTNTTAATATLTVAAAPAPSAPVPALDPRALGLLAVVLAAVAAFALRS
jgi:hypothetical protein